MQAFDQEFLLSVLVYCKETGEFTWRIDRGGKARAGTPAGFTKTVNSGKTYRLMHIKRKMYLAHRLAVLYVTGLWPEFDVDHEDGDGLNNKWGNLRCVTRAENTKNRRLNANNKSGVSGVSWREKDKSWNAIIGVNKKHIFLGSFKDFDAAVACRKDAEAHYGFHKNHGEIRPL